MTDQQRLLFDFVKTAHGDQVRKYTNAPYWEHLLEVAELASKYEDRHHTWEIGICHDLLEDTEVTTSEFLHKLVSIGYSLNTASYIKSGVEWLTDEYTKEKYPNLNREDRKEEEARRLGMMSPPFQSVKYADLISNSRTISEYDPDFAKTYLAEKRRILHFMRRGHIDLLIQCCHTVYEAQSKLELV